MPIDRVNPSGPWTGIEVDFEREEPVIVGQVGTTPNVEFKLEAATKKSATGKTDKMKFSGVVIDYWSVGDDIKKSYGALISRGTEVANRLQPEQTLFAVEYFDRPTARKRFAAIQAGDEYDKTEIENILEDLSFQVIFNGFVGRSDGHGFRHLRMQPAVVYATSSPELTIDKRRTKKV